MLPTDACLNSGSGYTGPQSAAGPPVLPHYWQRQITRAHLAIKAINLSNATHSTRQGDMIDQGFKDTIPWRYLDMAFKTPRNDGNLIYEYVIIS